MAPDRDADGASPRAPSPRFRPLPDWAGPMTRMVHGGHFPDLNAGAIVPPVYQTSTFRYPAPFSEASAHGSVRIYTREGNPTIDGPAEVLRELEGAEACRLFASGMGAISATLLSLVRSGDEVVAPDGLYGGTVDLLRTVLPRLGVRVHRLDPVAARSPESAVGEGTRLAFLETPTNPLLRVHDIRRWAEAVHQAGGILVVDNTFASPINQRPLSLGADLVVQSATKYLGGHSDLTAGALAGSQEWMEQVDPAYHLGAPVDPFTAFLLHRSLKTLGLRVERQNRNASALVQALSDEPSLRQIHYPGRASPDEETVAARQMSGRGGMLSLSLNGGRPAARRFLEGLRIVEVASSLGGVESLASIPHDTSHRAYTDRERHDLGIDDGLVRISVGVEDAGDLIRDLREALASA